MLAQLILGRPGAAERSTEASHRVSHDAADQIFLVREVVMERRDVDTDRRGYLARTQTLEATCGEDLVRRRDQGILPGLCGSCCLTFNQSDD